MLSELRSAELWLSYAHSDSHGGNDELIRNVERSQYRIEMHAAGIRRLRGGVRENGHISLTPVGMARQEKLKNAENTSGLSVVALQNAWEFGFAANAPLDCWWEVLIECRVVSADFLVRPLLVVLSQLHPKDIVQLPTAEAYEMVQHLALRFSDMCLDEGIFLRRLLHCPFEIRMIRTWTAEHFAAP